MSELYSEPIIPCDSDSEAFAGAVEEEEQQVRTLEPVNEVQTAPQAVQKEKETVDASSPRTELKVKFAKVELTKKEKKLLSLAAAKDKKQKQKEKKKHKQQEKEKVKNAEVSTVNKSKSKAPPKVNTSPKQYDEADKSPVSKASRQERFAIWRSRQKRVNSVIASVIQSLSLPWEDYDKPRSERYKAYLKHYAHFVKQRMELAKLVNVSVFEMSSSNVEIYSQGRSLFPDYL
jgi:hypothetical protein